MTIAVRMRKSFEVFGLTMVAAALAACQNADPQLANLVKNPVEKPVITSAASVLQIDSPSDSVHLSGECDPKSSQMEISCDDGEWKAVAAACVNGQLDLLIDPINSVCDIQLGFYREHVLRARSVRGSFESEPVEVPLRYGYVYYGDARIY